MIRRLLCSALALALVAGCQTTPRESAPAHVFASPEAGFAAMLAALRADNLPMVESMLGLRSEEILSGDPVSDRLDRANFLKLASQSWRVRRVTDTAAWVDCGREDWTFPVPLTGGGQAWAFDGSWGREEIRNRIIGRNELSTMATLRGLVEAQWEYHKMDPDGDGIPAYASRIFSTPGARDGLYWPAAKGAPVSPVGPMAAAAEAEGYSGLESGRIPFHGYHYRMLSGQGKNAPGGKRSFIDETGRMTGGFALVAWPADYGRSGVMTFVVNDRGLLFEKDLGRRTAARASRITTYNPDEDWNPVGTSAY